MKKIMLFLILITASTAVIHPFSWSSIYRYFKPLKTQKFDRAGVGIIVPLNNQALKNPSLHNYGIIVGHDKNVKKWMIGQAGQADKTDLTPEETAARELYEETGCGVKIDKDIIKTFPSLTTNDKKLFFMKSNDLTLAQKIQNSVQKAQHNPKLSSCCKEIDHIEIIKLSTLLELAQKIETNTLHQSDFKKSRFSNNCNYFITTTIGHKILVDGYYMRVYGNFAYPGTYQKAYKKLANLIQNS